MTGATVPPPPHVSEMALKTDRQPPQASPCPATACPLRLRPLASRLRPPCSSPAATYVPRPTPSAGQPYSLLWAESFEDDAFREKLKAWLDAGKIEHDLSHVRALGDLPAAERELGEALAAELRDRPAILGVFD